MTSSHTGMGRANILLRVTESDFSSFWRRRVFVVRRGGLQRGKGGVLRASLRKRSLIQRRVITSSPKTERRGMKKVHPVAELCGDRHGEKGKRHDIKSRCALEGRLGSKQLKIEEGFIHCLSARKKKMLTCIVVGPRAETLIEEKGGRLPRGVRRKKTTQQKK